MQTFTFDNGDEMHLIGLGTWKSSEGEVYRAVQEAIRVGYRHIDCAFNYGNEAEIGQAIADLIETGEIKREELWITSKLWNDSHRKEHVLPAIQNTMKDLQLDYLDLYLVHWPVSGKYKETWQAMEKLYNNGRIRAIGVSNFQIHHLKDLMKDAAVFPMVNQVEFHPLLTQKSLFQFCRENAIQMVAWSPLMQGNLQNPILEKLAGKYGKTPAQIVLRWDLQHRVVTIPKSVNPKRIEENSQIFDFILEEEDMQLIDAMNQNHRFGPDPDNIDF